MDKETIQIKLLINAEIIENRSNYALFNEGMKKGAEIAQSIILHQNRWRKVEEEMPEVGILVHVKLEHIPSGKTIYSHASFQKDYKDGFWSIDSAFGGKYKVTEWKRIEG